MKISNIANNKKRITFQGYAFFVVCFLTVLSVILNLIQNLIIVSFNSRFMSCQIKFDMTYIKKANNF